MKIGIYAGVYVGDVINHNIDYIGADQGVSHLLKLGIHPIKAIGDMDSIENVSQLEGLNPSTYSSIKDDTDTALAVQYAIDNGYDEIDLYGVTQGRMDHFMAVICLLEKYQDYHITIYDQKNKIQVLKPGKHIIYKDNYHYFSVFAFHKSIISLKDCHYPLDHYTLLRNDPLCVSNQMDKDHVMIETSESILFFQTH